MGCYIWYRLYSEEEPGRAAAQPSPRLAVPNVTAHPPTASVPTYIIRCGTIIAFALVVVVVSGMQLWDCVAPAPLRCNGLTVQRVIEHRIRIHSTNQLISQSVYFIAGTKP